MSSFFFVPFFCSDFLLVIVSDSVADPGDAKIAFHLVLLREEKKNSLVSEITRAGVVSQWKKKKTEKNARGNMIFCNDEPVAMNSKKKESF